MNNTEQALFNSMLARSFEPRQWYEKDDNARHDCAPAALPRGGGKIMWVYLQMGALWLVGFYDPNRVWHEESKWPSAEQAAERVHWLNGGAVA